MVDVRSGLLNGKLAEVSAAPTFVVPTWPGGPPATTTWGPLRLRLRRVGYSELRYDPPKPLPEDDCFWADLSLNSDRFDQPSSELAEMVHNSLVRAQASIPGVIPTS